MFKVGEKVLDDCGCVYIVLSKSLDRKGRVDRLWMHHKDDPPTQKFYLDRKQTERLKRVK